MQGLNPLLIGGTFLSLHTFSLRFWSGMMSQSPSNRGNLSQRQCGDAAGDASGGLNPLLIGGTFLSRTGDGSRRMPSRSLNPLLIGGTFLSTVFLNVTSGGVTTVSIPF